MKHYSTNLKHKLPATNDNSDVVLNSNFREWDSYIAENLNYRYPSGGIRYEEGRDGELLGLCRDHAESYQKPCVGGNTVIFTHPFYLHLSHMDEIENDEVGQEVNDYLDNFLNFLNLSRNKSMVNMVALETIHHYAAATSLLLEEGLVDRVIFTLYDNGCPLDIDELSTFSENIIFFGGGYNKKCLSRSIREMNNKLSSGEIWAIKELSLNSPQDYIETLKLSVVENVNPSRIISLEDVIKKLKLGF
jgi:hypothetical protein